MDKIEKAKQILQRYNQTHIKVDNEEIASQILNINFEQLESLYNSVDDELSYGNLEPVKATNPDNIPTEKVKEYTKIGEQKVKDSKFAVAIMAGGQGTRLGHKGPKGTFKVKINNEEKYLFEVAIEKLKKARKKYGVTIPCYIMTSPENNTDTVNFFEKNSYFGYPKEAIKCFIQEEMPLLDENGKLIVGEDGKIKLASEGNGGIFYSMRKTKVLDEMKEKGIEWVFIGAVDNLLVKYVDTLLLGLAISEKTDIATRTVIKANPHEKVGVICRQNNRIKVVEYTEISNEMLEAIDEQGEILFGESHIMCNLFSIKALEIASTNKLKYHVAHKKEKYLSNRKTCYTRKRKLL